MKKISSVRTVTFAALLGGFLGVVLYFPWEDMATKLLLLIEGLKEWQGLLLLALYIPAAVLFVPAFIVSLGAGFILGFEKSFFIISFGTTLGSVVAFILARTVGRNLVASKLAGRPKFQTLDRAIGKHAFKIVFLTRVAPMLSYNVLNYAYGITRVSFRDYVLGTWLGMIPASCVLAYLGASAKTLTEALMNPASRSAIQPLWVVLGVMVTVGILFFMTRWARQALQTASRETEDVDEATVTT